MIRKSMPSDLIRGWVPVFPRDKREAFARRSCSNKKIERDDDSKKSHPALERLVVGRIVVGRKFDRVVLLAGVELHDFPGNPGKYCRNRIDAKHRLFGTTDE